MNMNRVIIVLMFLILLPSCSHYSKCPPYPPMPDEVKSVLRDHVDDEILSWANKQLKLKQKLETCRELE
jgi:hypothetical protein